MLGTIVGDIIGSRFEFHPIKSCNFELFAPGCRFTDDTILTLATANVLLKLQPFHENYHVFYHLYPEVGYGRRFPSWDSKREILL